MEEKKLQQGQSIRVADKVYLVLYARDARTVGVDEKFVAGWLVSIVEFNGMDDHGFAKLVPKSNEDIFQFLYSGKKSEHTLGEFEVLPEQYRYQFGWRKS